MEIKSHLSNADFTEANKALIKNQRIDGTNGVSAQLDTSAYQLALLRKAIVSWNLTDHADKLLEVNDDTVGALPQVVFNKVYQAIEESEKEATPAAQATFPVAR